MALVPPPQDYYDRWGHQVWVHPKPEEDPWAIAVRHKYAEAH